MKILKRRKKIIRVKKPLVYAATELIKKARERGREGKRKKRTCHESQNGRLQVHQAGGDRN